MRKIPYQKMWIARHKRILLWHTARNILAIFYMFQIGFVHSCGTVFDDVQSKALLSQITIVGRITGLHVTPSSQQTTDTKSYTAVVQVLSVLKQPETENNESIKRKQVIAITGFLTDSENSSSLSTSSAQNLSTTTTSVTPSSTNRSCLSYATISQDYILFINRTSGTDQGRPTYHAAQLSTNYTKTDKKLIKDVLCEDCAQAPNAKAKRNLQETEGISNYKISCRVEGNPSPDVRWYRDGLELDDSLRGIVIKHKRRKGIHTASIRFKNLKLDHMGTYKCVARNVLGEDTAKTKLKVVPVNEPKTTPPPPESDDLDWDSFINVDDMETVGPPASHYIPCTGKDKNYCLHGGECKIYPDGRYRHCRCMAKFTGTRCEEANILPPSPPGSVIVSTTGNLPESVELMSAVIALAAVLAVLVILLLTLAFYCAGWRYRSQREKKSRRVRYTVGNSQPEACNLIEGDNSKCRSQPIAEVHTKASQTEPTVNSLQQLRRSLNLENYFPHSSSDVVLRRKSLGAASGRPASQPVDRRLTRSRLSGTSTLAENKRINDSEFDVLAERTPSSASLELDSTGTASSCGDNSQPHTNCDHESADTNSLYISESTLDSQESGKRLATAVRANKFTHRLHNKPLNTDNNANARKYKYHIDNGDA